jgi:hypothetical protein
MSLTYPIADLLTDTELARLGCSQSQVRGQPTGEKRPPSAGEWFISGPNNEVYRAPVALFGNYRIVKLVKGAKSDLAGNALCRTCHPSL